MKLSTSPCAFRSFACVFCETSVQNYCPFKNWILSSIYESLEYFIYLANKYDVSPSDSSLQAAWLGHPSFSKHSRASHIHRNKIQVFTSAYKADVMWPFFPVQPHLLLLSQPHTLPQGLCTFCTHCLNTLPWISPRLTPSILLTLCLNAISSPTGTASPLSPPGHPSPAPNPALSSFWQRQCQEAWCVNSFAHCPPPCTRT